MLRTVTCSERSVLDWPSEPLPAATSEGILMTTNSFVGRGKAILVWKTLILQQGNLKYFQTRIPISNLFSAC